MAKVVNDTFIVENTKLELNLSASIRAKCKNTLATLFDVKYESEETIRADLQVQFSNVAQGCITSLQTVFSRFKRSEGFIKLINSCFEAVLKGLGTHKRDLEMIQLNVDDVERTHYTKKDMQFASLLMKDYYHWKMIISDKSTYIIIFFIVLTICPIVFITY